ncbi:MAG: hypothetical protein Q9195_001981 [Heterodermia aff. obscurata]
MGPPPAKRQKRRVVLDSDDDASSLPKQPQGKNKASRIQGPNTRSKFTNNDVLSKRTLSAQARKERIAPARARSDSTQWTPPSSPDRISKGSRIVKGQSNGSLHTYLNSTRQMPTARKEFKHGAPSSQVETIGEPEDVIEDDSPDEKVRARPTTERGATVVLDRRKPLQEQTQNKAVTSSQEKPISASQRFLAVGKPVAKEASTQTRPPPKNLDVRPWAQRYGPASLDELMVHKKKVADVRDWFENVYSGRNCKRLLILRGPSGAGKTATLTALAKTMDVNVSEWKNPVNSGFSSEAYNSISSQFEDFIGRSGRFGNLDFADSRASTHLPSRKDPEPPTGGKQRKAIMMEEYPNTFTSTSQALKSFRSTILQYLATNTPQSSSLQLQQHVDGQQAIKPLVMIITETSTDATTSSMESFTAHRLLGPDILHHSGTSIIEFNPVAPTLLVKALELVIHKEARESGRRRVPGPSVLKKLAEVGDVRSAIGSLEFLCLRGGDGDDWGGRVADKSKKNANSAMTNMEKASIELLSQREASLGLFHAVGKIVYNKREEAHSANRPSQPPDHLPQHARLKVSGVSIDALMDETGTDSRTFIAALHENYVMSCESKDFIESLNDCLDALSDSDVLISDRNGRLNSARKTYHGAATDALRQDEIAFQTAVRGLLFALPHPVKRSTHPVKGGGQNGSHKLFYPASMRLGRQMEEIEDLAGQWSGCYKSATTLNEFNDSDGLNARIRPTKSEVILERLPYVAKIQHSKPLGANSFELERITKFKGFQESIDESLEDDELTKSSMEDKAMMPPPLIPAIGNNFDLDKSRQLGEDIGKLYLSDDDIEDD